MAKQSNSAEVVPGLFRLPGVAAQGVNAYVWHPRADQRGPDEPIVFDCGYPFSGAALTASLVALGCAPADIRTIAITHDDMDHTGRLHALQAASGAEVACGEWEANRLLSDTWRPFTRSRGLDSLAVRSFTGLGYRVYHKRPVAAARLLGDGETLAGDWIAVHTPGHTPGHTVYFHTRLRVLIAGDALGSLRRGAIRGPLRAFAEDTEEARESIRKMAALAPEVICFGHGPELHDAAAPLQKLADGLAAPRGAANAAA